jgi:protein-glutamine gamma-glutamyltransferase
VLLAQLFITDKMRDLRVALLLAVGMFVLAVANEPGAIVVVALLVGWPAVVAALTFAHAAHEESKVDTVAHASAVAPSAVWARVGLFAVVSGLVAVLAVLLVPHPDGVRPHPAGGAPDGDAPGSNSGPASRNPEAYTSGTLDMRARGELPGTEVAEVPRDSPALWRGAVLDYYDGVTWRAPADSGYGRALPGGPHFDLPLGDAALGTGAQRRDVVRRRAGFSGVLLAPGQPTAVDVAGGLLRLSGGFFISAGPNADYPDAYTVTSQGTDLARSELSRTPVAAPVGSGMPQFSLQLPSTVPERVRLLGQRITESASDRDAATRAVETYLRGHATYRLDSPVPPAGQDAVDNFLFVAHTGFCEQFAAAEVVLLRASGVPARLATGFAGGAPAGDHRTLLGSDAHAWVEVWYPGIGWAASDPTAGTRLADPSPTDRLSSWLRGTRGRLIVAGCLLVVTALVVLLGWALRRWARRAPDRRGAAKTAGRALPPVLAAFDRLQQALDDVGTPRAPAESVGELARRPAMAVAAGALAVVERTSYGARPPVGAEADDAERTLNELARRLREQAAERSAARG